MKICLLPLILTLQLPAFAAPLPPTPKRPRLHPGSGSFTFKGNALTRQKPIKVWYHKAKAWTPKDKVLFVMHGVKRNGKEYRDAWIKHAQKGPFLLLCPEFDKDQYPGSRNYNLGRMKSKDGALRDAKEWSFSVIDPIFDQVKESLKIQAKGYHIYGHSAGAQFVHRLVLMCPNAKVIKAIAANAGWYTSLDPKQEFPYGLSKSPFPKKESPLVFKKRLIILLGADDKDPEHKHLRRTRQAMAQGPHRFARGHHFLKSARAYAKRQKTPLNWDLQIVKGVGHSNAGMAKAAAKILNER